MQNMISSMPYMARRASSMELFLRGSRSAGRISAGHGEGADPDFATGHIHRHLQLPGRLCEVRGDQATHEFFSAVGLQAGGGAGPLQGDDLAPIGGCGHQCCHIWGQCTGSGLNLFIAYFTNDSCMCQVLKRLPQPESISSITIAGASAGLIQVLIH